MMQALGIFNLLKKIAGRKGISMDLYVSTRPEPWVPSAHLSDQALKMATELKSHVHKSKK
jgi:hypothetical protein